MINMQETKNGERMNFSIKELQEFSLLGQEVELTNFQNKNVQISAEFWKKFNINLKKSYLSQSANWVKYAVMEKRDDKLFYYCAIPKKVIVPDEFKVKVIPSHKYLVVEHVGPMNKIYETYRTIYKEILPNNQYILRQNDFLHFEKYDYRFHWNGENSVIEIWVPVQEKTNSSLWEEHRRSRYGWYC